MYPFFCKPIYLILCIYEKFYLHTQISVDMCTVTGIIHMIFVEGADII